MYTLRKNANSVKDGYYRSLASTKKYIKDVRIGGVGIKRKSQKIEGRFEQRSKTRIQGRKRRNTLKVHIEYPKKQIPPKHTSNTNKTFKNPNNKTKLITKNLNKAQINFANQFNSPGVLACTTDMIPLISIGHKKRFYIASISKLFVLCTFWEINKNLKFILGDFV